VPVILAICIYHLKYFIRTYKDLSRLKSVAGSPVLSHLGETITGVSTIRAFNKQEEFINKNIENLNHKVNVFFWKGACKSWFGIRITLSSILIFIFTAVF